MKKNSILLVAALFTSAGVWAQKTLTVEHKAADAMTSEITAALASAGGAAEEIEKLVITGSANVTFNDCRAIRAAFSTAALKTLDLSQAKFENDSLPGIPAGQDPNNVGAFNATVPYTEGSSTGLSSTANGLLVEEVVLPANLRVVSNRVFRNFAKLRTIVLPESVEVIDQGAFNKCQELRTINFPDGLKTIGDYAFFQCWRLGLDANNPVDELPEGMVGMLGKNAFAQTSVFISYIPEGITEIGEACFNVKTGSGAIVPGEPGHPAADGEEAGSLSLTIYQNVAKIGKSAFAGQKNIGDIEIHRVTPPETVETAFGPVTDVEFLGGIELYVPEGSGAAYEAIAPYNLMNIRAALPVPEESGVETINASSFSVYPNPVVNTISVTTQNAVENVKILDLKGSVVKNFAANAAMTFDVSDLSNGIYFIQLDNATVKFIKK